MNIYRLRTTECSWEPVEAASSVDALSIIRRTQWENANIFWLQVKVGTRWTPVCAKEEVKV